MPSFFLSFRNTWTWLKATAPCQTLAGWMVLMIHSVVDGILALPYLLFTGKQCNNLGGLRLLLSPQFDPSLYKMFVTSPLKERQLKKGRYEKPSKAIKWLEEHANCIPKFFLLSFELVFCWVLGFIFVYYFFSSSKSSFIWDTLLPPRVLKISFAIPFRPVLTNAFKQSSMRYSAACLLKALLV